MPTVIIFFLVHWYLAIFTHTFFYHRYAAHRHFRMSKGWERFFYVVTWLVQGSSYLSARAYGAMHRMHHAYADTDKDPHTPMKSSNPMSFMLDTRNTYFAIYKHELAVDDKYTRDLPEWKAFDRIAHNWITRFAWMGLYTAFYVAFATQWWMFLLLPVHFSMGAFQGAFVNWWAHKIGYKSFATKDTSHNLMPVDLFFTGESYHNNHHKFPGRVNYAIKWFEFDISYWVIKAMDAVGILEIRQKTSKQPLNAWVDQAA